MEMRRKELAVTGADALDKIIMDCDCIRLALADGDYPYIVPVNFGYQREDGQAIFYIHSGGAGRKLELCRANKRCGFELDTGRKLKTSEAPCSFSMEYESIIGIGDLVELTSVEEKAKALGVIMTHYSGKADWDFPEKAVEKTCVLRMIGKDMTGRKHT